MIAMAYGAKRIEKAAASMFCMLMVFGVSGFADAETIIHKERSLYRDITVYRGRRYPLHAVFPQVFRTPDVYFTR